MKATWKCRACHEWGDGGPAEARQHIDNHREMRGAGYSADLAKRIPTGTETGWNWAAGHYRPRHAPVRLGFAPPEAP
jgi:hypothetical protein